MNILFPRSIKLKNISKSKMMVYSSQGFKKYSTCSELSLVPSSWRHSWIPCSWSLRLTSHFVELLYLATQWSETVLWTLLFRSGFKQKENEYNQSINQNKITCNIMLFIYCLFHRFKSSRDASRNTC